MKKRVSKWPSDALETRETASYIRVTTNSNNAHLAKGKSDLKKNLQNFCIQSEQNSSHLVQVPERLWEKMVSEVVYIFVWGALVLLERYAKVCISDLHEAIEKLHKCLLFNLHGAFKKRNPPPSVTLPPQRDIQGTWYRTDTSLETFLFSNYFSGDSFINAMKPHTSHLKKKYSK